MEVPLQTAYCPPGTVLVIPCPGAATAIHDPRVEKLASLSCEVDAATPIKPPTFSAAGYCSTELPPLPAAATTTRFGLLATGKSSLAGLSPQTSCSMRLINS